MLGIMPMPAPRQRDAAGLRLRACRKQRQAGEQEVKRVLHRRMPQSSPNPVTQVKHSSQDVPRGAAELLSTTNLKVETISHEVGYMNPFVFSNTVSVIHSPV
ncbi:MAG TPA: hypothetical protein DDZ88_15160, partial [Verrucomicrobiales bacterium]|nr:hypothetical protein [Verrucomicrobiales bacterium]